MKPALFIVVIFLFVSCGGGPLKVESVSLGGNADKQGVITDKRLDFTFKRPLNPRRAADLINHIYFQGDCIHFSFKLSRPVSREKISVVFSGPNGKGAFPAERLDVRRNRVLGISTSFTVYGFSLVGSVLERFHQNELEGPPPADGFCCRDIPLEISIDIEDPGGHVNEKMTSAFRIGYE